MVLTKTNLGSIPYARLFTALSFASLILWEFDTVTKAENGRGEKKKRLTQKSELSKGKIKKTKK
jgi:hypothetical protein